MMFKNYLWHSESGIKIGYTDKDKKFVEETILALQKSVKYLSDYFHLEKKIPIITVILVPNRKEYDRLVEEFLRVDIEKPSKPSRVAQTQRRDMVLLSPSAYSKDSIYKYYPDEFKRLIFHETTHIVEEFLSPDIEVLPRWWSEGLATYFSEQWQYEDEFRAPVLEGLKKRKIPDLKEIQNSVILSYQWGWTIVKCIESCYGQNMILDIIKKCKDGDVIKVIGETNDVFEKKWKEYLMEQAV